MILISWFKELKSKNPRTTPSSIDQISKWLLDLLACLDLASGLPAKDSLLPYAELSRTYAKMRTEASLLLRAVESSGMLKSVLPDTKFNLDTLGVDDAINFVSRVSHPSSHSTGDVTIERNILDDLESTKQRLLTTSSYLRCVQVCS